MKKSIVTFFVLVVTLVSFAQNDTEHLTFKGVPIDGTLSEYVKKMKNAGFEYLEGGIDYAVLQGDFAGFKDCNVLIYTLDAINVVSKICVLFPECNVWSSLEQNYNLLKSMLSVLGTPCMRLRKAILNCLYRKGIMENILFR